MSKNNEPSIFWMSIRLLLFSLIAGLFVLGFILGLVINGEIKMLTNTEMFLNVDPVFEIISSEEPVTLKAVNIDKFFIELTKNNHSHIIESTEIDGLEQINLVCEYGTIYSSKNKTKVFLSSPSEFELRTMPSKGTNICRTIFMIGICLGWWYYIYWEITKYKGKIKN